MNSEVSKDHQIKLAEIKQLLESLFESHKSLRTELSGGLRSLTEKQDYQITRVDQLHRVISTQPLFDLHEDLPFELISNGQVKTPMPFEDAEAIRKEIPQHVLFIDDELMMAYWDGKHVKKLKGLMYRLLLHFIVNEGVGGDVKRLRKVWEYDPLRKTVEAGIRRLRDILNEKGIGSIEVEPVYLLKPLPKYKLLRRSR